MQKILLRSLKRIDELVGGRLPIEFVLSSGVVGGGEKFNIGLERLKKKNRSDSLPISVVNVSKYLLSIARNKTE